MTPEQQAQALKLLREALVFAPRGRIDKPGAEALNLGDRIELFLQSAE